MAMFIGCDIGTVSVKAAVLATSAEVPLSGEGKNYLKLLPLDGTPFSIDCNTRIYLSPYKRITGNPINAAREILMDTCACFEESAVTSIAVTGSGAELCAEHLSLDRHSAAKALAVGVGTLHPDVDTILEMGGENSKLLRIEPREGDGSVGIVDYASNGDCAAGTGSFLDQQASRLCYSIEEMGDIVGGTDHAANIAGRCSVFAKTDMIHAQQRGATPPQILRGLCEAVAHNFKANVAKGRNLHKRAAFVGGVAHNHGVYAALLRVFSAEGDALFIPQQPAYYAAIGAALLNRLENRIGREGTSISTSPQVAPETVIPSWPRLTLDNVRQLNGTSASPPPPSSDNINAYLGIDIGSVSTNLVLMDPGGTVLHEIYLRTQARPIQIVSQGLKELSETFGDRLRILGAGTTGSGRELIGELVGADTIKDEITAHKTGSSHVASLHLDTTVDTIFEIGGQDSKFIRIDNGVVVDFAMNEACAAGTGSFLDEQAEKMGVNIVDEFARRALATPSPVRLGERCTVFMEMDITGWLRKGAAKDDVIAGLAYSVAQNYLSRVVRGRPIGETIFFQGGTAYNKAIAAAFAAILGKDIIVPPHNGVLGAYGAALLARDKMQALKAPSSFRGFDIEAVDYSIREFTCRGCSNRCDIQEFTVAGNKSYWGDKCSERFRQQPKTPLKPVIDDLLEVHRQALLRDWFKVFITQELNSALQRKAREAEKAAAKTPTLRLGMLQTMNFYHRYPFWHTYLRALGHEISLSGITSREIKKQGIETCVAEPCFPIQVTHGHLLQLQHTDIDRVFIPCHINEATDDLTVQSHVCLWAQGLSAVLKHSPAAEGLEEKWLSPLVHFRQGEQFVEKQLWSSFSPWAASRRHHRIAVELGFAAQSAFEDALKQAGRKALDDLAQHNAQGLIVVGRPYNIYDPAINLNLCDKLRSLYGANVIPLDFLPSDGEDLRQLNSNMFWNYGRKILRTTLWARKRPHLHIIYLTSFQCGPDSYVKTFAADGAGKPFLTLQYDGHSNDVGMMTRCEAYLDSKGLLRWWQTEA